MGVVAGSLRCCLQCVEGDDRSHLTELISGGMGSTQ